MTELRPLLSEHHDEFEVALLRSAERDEPRETGKLRVAAALGLGVSATAGSLAAATGVSGVAGVSVTAGKLGLPLVLKSLAIGTATGLLTLGAFDYVELLPSRADAPAAVVVQAPRAQRPAAELARPEPQAVDTDHVGSVEGTTLGSATDPAIDSVAPVPSSRRLAEKAVLEPPTEPAVPAASAAEPAAAAEAAPPTELPEPPRAASIAGEVAEIDRIRSALRQGQARAALSGLEQYFRASPTRVLETEATILKVDALVALGERERARALAREFVSRQPMSRHAERLRQLAEE
jgi:hypothetical protein